MGKEIDLSIKDTEIMTFGKYKGEKFANIPASYFLYIRDNMRLFGVVKQYINENLEELQKEVDY